MSERKRYFGGFTDWLAMAKEWYGKSYEKDWMPPDDFPTDDQILFAAYGLEGSYEGSAFVLFEQDGKLYENVGGHCSCYGLEDQWDPEETTWEALKMGERLSDYAYDSEAISAYKALLKALLKEH